MSANERNAEKEAISAAETWARGLWEQAQSSWTRRSQDTNYRDLVVRPALIRELGKPHEDYNALDYGCGDGAETQFMYDYRRIFSPRSMFFGYDINLQSIERASKKYHGPIFFSGDFRNFIGRFNLQGRLGLVTSIFVLQEIPDIETVLEDIHASLRHGGVMLSVIVNPQFEDAMKTKGAIKVNEHLVSRQWEYAGEYPIVESDSNTFYLPCFHRNLSTYVKLFENSFRIEDMQGLEPDYVTLESCIRKGTLPFCKQDNNVYWPEIIYTPSSILIRAVKK